MEIMIAKLTVLFEEPFWVGVYEREWDGKYEVCKITFGAEPKNYEVYQFLLAQWHRLRFSACLEAAAIAERRLNPKRMQREAQKAMQNVGIGTKAQQALKLQQEQGKLAHQVRSKAQKEAELERQFVLRQEKRKEKRRGH